MSTIADRRAALARNAERNNGPRWEPDGERVFINSTGRCVADRSCVLTGYTPQAAPVAYDPTYANNPNLTAAQERELSRRDVRFDRGFNPRDFPPGHGLTEEEQYGVEAPGWPVANPVPVPAPSIFARVFGRTK